MRILWVFYGDSGISGFQNAKRVDNNKNYGIINCESILAIIFGIHAERSPIWN
jgi:hypothetical protein